MSVRFPFPQGVINNVALAQGTNTPLSFAQAPVAFGSAALAMTKSILQFPQFPYNPIIYGIVVQNVGTIIATGVIVEDHAIPPVSFINVVPTIGTPLILNSSTIRVALGNMIPGQIAVVYVVGIVL